jgi:photosystem II stability/assembly factor-like uncharacterized protein
MKFPRYFCIVAAFVALSALHAGAQAVTPQPSPTPSTPQSNTAQIVKAPVVALPIKNFKLLSSGTGWVSTGSQLLFTTDNGAHWKDISPPNPNQDGYSSVFFLDADTGWVLLSHDIQEGENPTPKSVENNEVLYVSATTNGGTTWTKEDLPTWEGQHGLNGGGIITFADKLHGWMSLAESRNRLFADNATLSTSDGGKTWIWANSGIQGEVKGILAVTDKDIWMVGRGRGEDGSQFGVSHDGGESFQAVVMPVPKEFSSFGYPEYTLPTFTDNLNGYEAVTYSDYGASKSVAVMYATKDGGRTWKQDRLLSNLAEEETVESTVAGSVWILPFAPPGQQLTLVKLLSGDKIAATAHKDNGDFNNCELSFLTVNDGWMNCSGSLSSTIDGGSSWANISPRAHNGVLTTDPITPVPAPKPIKTYPLKLANPKPGQPN